MDLAQRLAHLEGIHDWQGLLEELEQSLGSTEEPADKAQLHLKIGRLLSERFVQGVRALKHFQDAYKQNNELLEALDEARAVYWSLGKLNMVQKLLELQLKNAPEGPHAPALLLELGDVFCDAGNYDGATEAYARALGASGGDLKEASACLEDTQVDDASWQERIGTLLRDANEAAGPDASRLFLRAARLARRFASGEVEGLLKRGYGADPQSAAAAALYEGLLLEREDVAGIDATQEEVLGALEGVARSDAAVAYGKRWASRHQDADRAAKYMQAALAADPNEAAFTVWTQVVGARDNDWEKVAEVAKGCAARVNPPRKIFFTAQAGLTLWRNVGDLIRARQAFSELAFLAPQHPAIKAFELQIGQEVEAVAPADAAPAEAAPAEEAVEVEVDAGEPAEEVAEVEVDAGEPAEEAAPAEELAEVEVDAGEAAPAEELAAPAEEAEAAAEEPAEEAAAPAEEAEEAAEPVEEEPPPPPPVDEEKIAALRAKAEKQMGAKRLNEYVRTMVALGDELGDPLEKLEAYRAAADLYVNKFSNHTEATKTYEKIMELDPDDGDAVEYLKGAYQKRRDWEKLLRLMKREADALDGPDRSAKLYEIAKLGSERVRKPDITIGLWQDVLDDDAENVDALAALAQLYERSRDYEKLVGILEKQAELTYDTKPKLQILTKMGQIYGDRLGNDEGAVNAWRQLLTIEPNDRRAQEALKKKYLALGRWDDLEVFYAESGKWDEFIRLLESNESREKDPANKISLLMKAAQLWLDKKQKSDRASRAYEKILNIDAENLAAAEALIPIYQGTNNAKGLANAIEVKLIHEEDPITRLDLLREVANIYETTGKAPDKAFERYLSAFGISPNEDQCLEDVERLARATSGWEAVITAYRAAVTKADEEGDAYLAVGLRLRLGRILVEEVEKIDEALAEYRAVYEADGENAEAINALENLYRQTERYQELLGIYEKKRDLTDEPEARRETLYAIARLHENELGDKEQAVATYRVVLESDPADGIALKALDDLYRQLEAWEPYVEILRSRIELVDNDEDQVDLKYRLGQTLEKHMGDAADAVENYREILMLDQEHEGARVALEAILENEELSAEAARILEPIYELRSEWEKLITALGILAQAEEDLGERVELLRKIAGTAAGNLGDVNRAFDATARALKEDPANQETRTELESYAAQAEAWDRLDAVFREIAESLEDETLAREYWMHLARIVEQLGKVDEAAGAYAKVLELNPADAEALAAMDALYRGAERWTDLISVYRRRIELADDPVDREQLFGQMATVYEEKLEQPDQAIAAYQEVLSTDQTSQLALSALDALFTRQQMWVELADNLEAQLRLAETDEEQLELMLRLAALREGQMSQIEQAIEIYREVLDRDPTNEAALAALERLGQGEEHELTIAEILEPLYRQSGDFEKLIGVHEVQVRRSDDPTHKVDLLHQIAELYEDAAGDLNQAFDTFARALAVDPGHEATQDGLDRLARATGRFQDLAKVFEELAATQEDQLLSCTLFAMSARVYENDIGDTESAINHYRKVLSIDGENLDSAESLERLFRIAERYPDLSQILQRKAQILQDMEEQKDALFQSANIEEDVLERREEAIAVYLKILEIDPEDMKAIDSLINLYLGLKRWEELLGIYQKKVDLVYDTDEKKSIYYQQGAVFERELGDVPRAIDTYQRVLEIDPDDLAALGRLDVLYQTAENWQELLNVLQHESELTADAAESISFQYRIGELYEKHLEDPARAVEIYRDILGQQPDHEPTLAALEGLKSGEQDPLAAAMVLEPVYESIGDWTKLISVLEVQVRFSEEPYSQVDLLHRIATLYEENTGDIAAAFETQARALPVDNANEDTLLSLERLGGTIERWPDVAKLYDVELDKLSEEPDRFVELGLRVAQIYEIQLEDVDSAVGRYRKVMEVEPENQNAVRSLDRLFSQTERWQDLALILQREAEIGETPDEILEFKYRYGQLQQTQLDDLGSAIAAYRDILAAAPEHQPTLDAVEDLFAAGTRQVEIAEILEPLYQASMEWEKLAKVLEAQLANMQEPEDRLNQYYRIAENAEEQILDGEIALDVYVRALKEHPLDERARDEVERLAALVDGGWEKLANAYADITGTHESAEVRASIGKRLARVFEEELADVANAEETYRYVLTVNELEPEALANLDRLATDQEKWEDLAGVLEQRVKAPQEYPEDLVELYARLGEVYETQLEQVDDAIRAYRRIFDELDKEHENAIYALERLYEQKEAWTELLGVFDRQLETAMGDVQEADIRAKMANLLSEKLGDISRAMDTWKRVLDLRGEDPEALLALANLYEKEGHWGELTEILERQADVAESDEERADALIRRAQTFSGQLGRDEQALEDWYRVLDIDYSNVTALKAVNDLRRKAGDPHELVASLHQTVDRAGALLEGDELKEIFRELGKTYGGVLEQPYDAADAWNHLLEVDPGDFEAMDALEAIHREEERWEDVITVKMGRAAALEEEEERIRELLEVAGLWEEKVEDKDGGREAFEKILEIQGAHDQAFLELETLHKAAARWEPLIELYLARLDTRESASEANDLLRRIAKVFEEHLDDANQAFDALVTAFSQDYADNATVDYLGKMAQATGRWGELIQSTNGFLEADPSREDRITLLLRLAKWYGEDLNRPDYAQPYFQQVMQLDPNNVAVMRQMASLYRKNSQWQQLGQVLTRALDVAVQETDRKEILTELGDVLYRQMKEVDQGMSFYNRALEVDAHHVPAIEALEGIYAERGQHSDLVRVLGQKVPGLTEDADVAETKLRMGALYEEQLNDLDAAGNMYQEALDIEVSNLTAMRGLERVYGTLQKWAELVQILEAQLDVVTSERERLDVLFKIAKVQEEQFLKSDIAAARLEQILEIDPNHEPALEALEFAYRRLRQWHDLIGTYERHIDATQDRDKKIEVYGHIALVYADEIEDLDRAIDAYLNITDIDDQNIPALDALAKLYDKQDDTGQAIDYMTRVADLTTDGSQRVEMYYRIGRVCAEKMDDQLTAQDRYEMALDLDPSHLPTLGAIRAIAVENEDWDRATMYLEQEQQYTQAPRARARLLVELGRLRAEQLEEHESAIEAYQQALESDPESEEAAHPLMLDYMEKERWEEAEPLAELLVRKSNKRERSEQHEFQKALAKISFAQEKNDKALKAYQAAIQLDLTDAETIRGLAEVKFRLKDWPGALTNYQKVLTSLGEDEVEDRAYVYYRLGCIKGEQGQAKQAINNYEKALALEPSHRPTLEALVDVYTGLSDWKEVAEYKRQILDNVLDGDERFTLLLEIAKIWTDNEPQPAKAIEALEEALDLRPDDHRLLNQLLPLYQATENWERMVDTIQRLMENDDNKKRRSRYLFTLAQLYRDKMEDQHQAVEYFNLSLDEDPTFLQAFQRIERILTKEKEWKELERAYRKMLFRLQDGGNAEVEYKLAYALGLIYRDRQKDLPQAIEAFKLAQAKKPEEQMVGQVLAELYEIVEDMPSAVAAQLTILRADPKRIEPYRALYRLHHKQSAYDEAWCMCAALSFLRKATDDERQFFNDYRPNGLPKISNRLDNGQWVNNLLHEDAKDVIGKIFEMLAPAALAAKIAQLQAQGKLPALDERFRQDPASSTVTFARTFGWASQALGIVNTPQLYVRSDIPGGLASVTANPPAIMAGQAVLSGLNPQELVFVCGKQLSMYRGEFFMRTLFTSRTELEAILFAGIRLAKPDFALPPAKLAAVDPVARALAPNLDPRRLDGLKQAVKVFFKNGAKVNLKKWIRGVELTNAYAGLLLCGDLEVARKILRSEPTLPGDLSPEEKMKKLLLFSVSEQYFALRKHLGINIGE